MISAKLMVRSPHGARPFMNRRRLFPFSILVSLLLGLCLSGCSSLYLGDCPDGDVIGVDEPRIRSWRLRTFLADEAAAAQRLADYAAMSAYAYVEPPGSDCGHKAKVSPDDAGRLQDWLRDAGWQRVPEAEYAPACEDEVGLYYHVWKRSGAARTELVLSFRGTWGFNDWWYGNAYWLRRLFTDRHQYTAARQYADRVLDYFAQQGLTGETLAVSTTGHSLGGGLAQAVLYDHIHSSHFHQAYAFAPSSATAYTTRQDTAPFAACDCGRAFPEPRIYRIYESYEILANLRIFHKLVFPPEPWINEVRFNYAEGSNPVAQHSMLRFALTLIDKADSAQVTQNTQPWYAATEQACTAKFVDSQQAACREQVCK